MAYERRWFGFFTLSSLKHLWRAVVLGQGVGTAVACSTLCCQHAWPLPEVLEEVVLAWGKPRHSLCSASLFLEDLVSHEDLISYAQVKCSPKACVPLDPGQSAAIFLLLSSQVLQTRSRELSWQGVGDEAQHKVWGWNDTTLGHRCRQSRVFFLYLLYLYLPTLYTIEVASGLFLGHFRNISARAISGSSARLETVVPYTTPTRMYTK